MVFEQRRNHRTQLRITTNNIAGSGVHDVSGPLPYVYVAYSTVNMGQASPVVSINGNAVYQVVCPLPTHAAYATLDTGATPISGTVLNAAGSQVAFDGCYPVIYNGFAPALDVCTAGFQSNKLVTGCTDKHANSWTFSVQDPAACTSNLPTACLNQLVATFDGVSGLLTAKLAGGGGTSVFAGASVSGDSDYRIYSDGSPVSNKRARAMSPCHVPHPPLVTSSPLLHSESRCPFRCCEIFSIPVLSAGIAQRPV